MNKSSKEMTAPEIGMLAITQGALVGGIGLLLSQSLSESRRSAVGWALLLFGIATTIPLAFELFGDRAK
jgi:hypothetical protein